MFVSHRLEEVFAISQRITVMRDGRVVGSGPIGEWTTDEVIRKMVGRSLEALYPKEKVEPGKVVLRVRDLRRAGVFKGISFEVRAGEIVGLAGLVGAGRSEVARAIFGIDPLDSGEVLIGDKALTNHTPQTAMAAGIGFVPEDRQQQGLVMEMTVMRNVTLTVLRQVQRFGLVSQKKEREIAAHWTQRMRLKGHIEEPANILSGGNQQKVVLAKWLATQPKLLIVDEPTRGVDVGAKSEVHRTLSQLAQRGDGDHHDFQRIAGSHWDGRPRSGDARREAHRRAGPFGSDRRGDHVRRDRPNGVDRRQESKSCSQRTIMTKELKSTADGHGWTERVGAQS